VDVNGSKVGVCGQGIKVAGNGTQILENTVVGSRLGFEDAVATAMLANDSSPTFGQITVRRNIVEDGPGDIYVFGPAVPNVLKVFKPAKITQINGTAVSGTNGDGSPCPGCKIDFYRDDADAIGETLVYLGEATAAANGSFNFTLAQPLPAGFGIRTSSTTQSAGVIGSYLAGTTTQFSKLFLPMSNVTIAGPTTGTAGTSYPFTITVSPAGATTPLTYEVSATNFNPGVFVRDVNVLTFSLQWTTTGVKTIEVTVSNDLGTKTDTHQITVTGTCYTLTLTHTGSGSNPVATPANSPGCANGRYVAGAQVNLAATPGAGWQVASWTGTANNSSKATSNSLTMPAANAAASVVYQQIPVSTGGDIYLPLIRR
jgi:hypothetical protein